MAVDRLSVTVPSELGAALRALAASRGETVSTLVTEAIERQVRMAALDDALAAMDKKFGPVPDDMVAAAAAELLVTRRRARRRPRRRA